MSRMHDRHPIEHPLHVFRPPLRQLPTYSADTRIMQKFELVNVHRITAVLVF